MARRSPRAAALRAVKVAAAVADRVAPPQRGIVVLVYHRVGARSGSEVDLDPGLFRDQMAHVADRAVSLHDALARLDEPPTDGPDPVVVTFDDGTADVVDHALPALVDLGVPATLYVATSFVDRAGPGPFGGAPVSWAALAEAQASGVLAIGSHTHTHALLDRLPPAAAADDLDRSIGLVEEHLGTTPRDFAYPKAVAPSPAVAALVGARFRSAALAGTRANRYGRTDPQRLSRSPIQVADGMRWFRAKVEGGMALEDALRRRLNRSRYADAAM